MKDTYTVTIKMHDGIVVVETPVEADSFIDAITKTTNQISEYYKLSEFSEVKAKVNSKIIPLNP